MLEWLAAATGVELGKLVLEQVLNLSKSAMEDYTKDFFKSCLKGSVAWASADVLKKPMTEAVGCFIKRFIKELQFNDVPETSIEHHYKAAIKRFVQDKAVRPILGKAFEKDCKRIDDVQLQQIWTQQYQVAEWQFPAVEFDWRGVAKEYVVEVKGIIKANSELRSLLEVDLLETIAQNTTEISPGFDVICYRQSLQTSYGYLKLYTLDSTDRMDAIKLWRMFIEQTVREALPPMRYELPLDLKRQLQEQGYLEADLSAEALEHYRQEYFQQPSRKVLEAIADAERAVVLGDPGAGKSTLLQYLALEWVETKTDTLPLLIELREYAIAPTLNFLEFLHRGKGVDWQFDQQQLHQHLLDHPTLVMFDGLDEVFDRHTQATVMDDIIRFTQQYPKARVLVTSRIIGYNPERFQHAQFKQFTIQPLDDPEIQTFIDRWYDLAMGSDPDKERLKQRLQDAIANSKAIANLADNPLLLTMMSILNRRQELPRDRADLYDQASRVLLYHWDVDHKRLQLPMDAIGRREKQEMLRLIAYEMQAGEEGLKGNLIGAERLTRVLTDYLRDQGFSEPREKANVLIQQLRERNFILCYRGADTYGFVHRTFLEYFCALEIVHRFEKQRTLTFEQLRDEVFGQHWRDETWHEILCLICSMVDPKYANKLVDFLLNLFKSEKDLKQGKVHNLEKNEYPFEEEYSFSDYFNRKLNFDSRSLLLAFVCSQEISAKQKDTSIHKEVIKQVKDYISELQNFIESGDPTWDYWSAQVIYRVFSDIVKFGKGEREIFEYLKDNSFDAPLQEICSAAILALTDYWANSQELLELLVNVATENPFDTSTFSVGDPNLVESPRKTALKALLTRYPNHSKTVELLRDRAVNEPDEQVRWYSANKLAQFWGDEPDVLEFLFSVITNNTGYNPHHRVQPCSTVLGAVVMHCPTHPKTIELLHDKATNDPDLQVREWAQQQLEQLKLQP